MQLSVLSTCLLALLLNLQHGYAHASNPDMCDVLGAGYQENREKFRNYTMSFTLRHGNAESLEDAQLTGPTANVVSAEGKWVVGGNRHTYVLNVDKGVLERSMKSSDLTEKESAKLSNNARITRMVHVPIAPVIVMFDGKRQLKLDGVLGGGGLCSHSEAPEISVTPWDFCEALGEGELMAPANAFLKLARRFPHIQVEYLGEVLLGQHQLHHARLEDSIDEFVIDYYLDANCGFLPRRIEMRNAGNSSPYRIVRVTPSEGLDNRWFPERIVVVRRSADDSLPAARPGWLDGNVVLG